MCENLTWSNYDRNPVLPVLWKCLKMHFLSLIFDLERSRLDKLWIRNNLEFMEWTIQNCPQMLFYVTCRHFYRPLKSCDIRFGMEEVKRKSHLNWKLQFAKSHNHFFQVGILRRYFISTTYSFGLMFMSLSSGAFSANSF